MGSFWDIASRSLLLTASLCSFILTASMLVEKSLKQQTTTERKQQAEEVVEARLSKVESELDELKKQHAKLAEAFQQQNLLFQRQQQLLLLQQQQQQQQLHQSDRRSDVTADYVNVFGSVTPQLPQYEVASWSNEKVVEWVEKVLGNNSASQVFEAIDGQALLDMLIDDDNHGFSFGDKCFFMGVDREACNVLERASGELLLLLK